MAPSNGVDKHQLICEYDLHKLAAEAVQSAALALESINNIHRCDSLPACVLRVCNSIADDVLEEHLEHRAGLLINQTRNTLHTASTSETTDSRLSDALDVVAQHLPVTLGTALPETLATFSTARHVFVWMLVAPC